MVGRSSAETTGAPVAAAQAARAEEASPTATTPRGAASPPSGGADNDGILRASRKARTGVHTLGEGDDAVTVYSPGADQTYKGSARYDRDKESRKAAAEREDDVKRWDKKRSAAWDGEGGEPGMAAKGPNMMMLLLIVLLLLTGIVGAKVVMGGRS